MTGVHYYKKYFLMYCLLALLLLIHSFSLVYFDSTLLQICLSLISAVLFNAAQVFKAVACYHLYLIHPKEPKSNSYSKQETIIFFLGCSIYFIILHLTSFCYNAYYHSLLILSPSISEHFTIFQCFTFVPLIYLDYFIPQVTSIWYWIKSNDFRRLMSIVCLVFDYSDVKICFHLYWFCIISGWDAAFRSIPAFFVLFQSSVMVWMSMLIRLSFQLQGFNVPISNWYGFVALHVILLIASIVTERILMTKDIFKVQNEEKRKIK